MNTFTQVTVDSHVLKYGASLMLDQSNPSEEDDPMIESTEAIGPVSPDNSSVAPF